MPRVVPAVRDLVPPLEDALDVELARERLRRARRVPRGRDDLARPQERLRRQAGVVRALTAGELAFDDDDLDVRVEPPERADEVLSARTGPQHDHASLRAHRDLLYPDEPVTVTGW